MYLVERYEPVPEAAWPAVAGVQAGDRPDGAEPPIRLVLSTMVPTDEISLSLFEAPSETALGNALAAGGLSFIRIVEAVVRAGSPTLPSADGRAGGQV
jgi:hypothetical protein